MPHDFSPIWWKILLRLLGAGWIVAGIALTLYFALFLRPQVVTLTENLEASLVSAEQGARIVERAASALEEPLGLLDSTARMTNLLPETLTAMEGSLLEASNALASVGAATEEAKGGISGLVMPQKELTAGMTFSRRAADQLRLLGKMVKELKTASSSMASSAEALSRSSPGLRESLQSTAALARESQERLKASQREIADIPFGALTILAGLGSGAFCITIGLGILALASLQDRIGRLSATGLRTETLSSRRTAA